MSEPWTRHKAESASKADPSVARCPAPFVQGLTLGVVLATDIQYWSLQTEISKELPGASQEKR